MNVLKAHEKEQVLTLIRAGLSAREIHRRMGFDRTTVARYAREAGLWPEHPKPAGVPMVATDSADGQGQLAIQNPPPRPPGQTPSNCELHRDWIEEQVKLGRNAVAIYQDLVDKFAFKSAYNSVKRFCQHLRHSSPEQFDILEYGPGEESQVDYGKGAPTKDPKTGRYRMPRLFVMTLKYSRRSFRKVVWNSSQQTWAQLHEEAFRYFGGCPQYVVLDNLKEGVLKPDIYEPLLNPTYAAMLAHYGVVADPARVRDPNRKGTVESAIKHTQDTALKGRKFETIEEQNAFLLDWEDRWASRRIHGRVKRQVEEMFQEERPHLIPLPLTSMKYFKQETRTVWGDGCVQVGQSYYGANPLSIGAQAMVRIYNYEIEILHPKTQQVVRRHSIKLRPGSFSIGDQDRIFNPSRDTHRLLRMAQEIGPYTEKLCQMFFKRAGRASQRGIQAIVSLARKYSKDIIESACKVACEKKSTSARSVRLILENQAKILPIEKQQSNTLAQSHELIRPAQEYGELWDWAIENNNPSSGRR